MNQPGPLVSCLMVTRRDVRRIAIAMKCFLYQDYPHRDLLIVTDNNSPELTSLVAENSAQHVRLVEAPGGLTLGDLRNFAAARANGEIVCQWDDDDLYDPHRITASVEALTRDDGAAVLLEQWLVWWPARRVISLSKRRLWEGSLVMWKRHHGIYPALSRQEDTRFMQNLAPRAVLIALNAPELYLYVIHGDNTWPDDHFEEILDTSEQRWLGEEYDAKLRDLSSRLPIAEYKNLLGIQD